MTLSTISIAADDRIILLLELTHPLWPGPMRFANDTRDWTVTQDGGPVLYPAAIFDATAAGSDDTGADVRATAVPDVRLDLFRRCMEVIGAVDGEGAPLLVRATFREYAASNTAAPLRISRLELNMPTLTEEGRIEFTAAASDLADRKAPVRRYTTTNSPGLRR